jgi:dienelactone hydrolase
MPQRDDDIVFGPEVIYPRQKALFDQYQDYLLRTIRAEYDRRGRFWNRDFSSPAAYERSVEPNREHFLASLGGWPWERQDLRLRTERLYDFAAYSLDRVTYRLFDTIETDALLLTPHGAGPFPAVLAQAGVNCTPERICGYEEDQRDGRGTYHRIGARLAAHGYVVLATRMVTGFDPHLTRDPDHRAPTLLTPLQAEIRAYLLTTYGKEAAKQFAPQTRARLYLNRLCKTIGRDLMGMEMFALSRGVDLLASLPTVRSDRIGMYGLSQGGLSALFLGPLEKRLQAVVCAMYFNERFHKQVIQSDLYGCFALSSQEDHLYPHLMEFADSDLASLICPRAFFVEAGRHDDAVYWELAQQAFDEVKTFYTRLGIPERCEMFIHEGVHETEPVDNTARIHAVTFLDRWLK